MLSLICTQLWRDRWPLRRRLGPPVRPAELLALEIDGEAVGEAEEGVHEDGAVGPVQAGGLDARPVAVPVGPEQPP